MIYTAVIVRVWSENGEIAKNQPPESRERPCLLFTFETFKPYRPFCFKDPISVRNKWKIFKKVEISRALTSFCEPDNKTNLYHLSNAAWFHMGAAIYLCFSPINYFMYSPSERSTLNRTRLILNVFYAMHRLSNLIEIRREPPKNRN